MFNRSRVTFVEELPDIDETSIIENYEHSNPKQPSGPPPPLPTKSNNSAYSSYGNVYGSNEQPKRPPSGPPMPTTMGPMGGNFKDESREKDALLQRAQDKLPSRQQGRIIAPDEDDDRRYEYPRDDRQSHHSHSHPYIIYEENPGVLPKYTVSRPPSRLRPVQPPQPPSYPMYPPPHSPPPVYPHQPIYNPQGPPPPNMMPPDQVASVCNMINKHLSSCALCSKLYTSNIKHQQKLGAAACGTGLRKNMNAVIYTIIILLLIITCIVLFRKLYNKTNIV
jgi:hypothetical protein